jgi:hypothetical protein
MLTPGERRFLIRSAAAFIAYLPLHLYFFWNFVVHKHATRGHPRPHRTA